MSMLNESENHRLKKLIRSISYGTHTFVSGARNTSARAQITFERDIDGVAWRNSDSSIRTSVPALTPDTETEHV